MNFCQPHWDLLRKAIDDRGLTALVAKDAERVAQNLRAQIDSADTLANYDPLMSAMWAINCNAIQFGGLALLTPGQDGKPPCPLCWVTADHAACCRDPECTITGFDDWVEKAADAQLEHVRRLAAGGGA